MSTESFNVVIEPKHFATSMKYADNDHCPLAEALREMFPYFSVKVYQFWVTLSDVRYDFEVTNWEMSPPMIDKYIRQAKLSTTDIPTISITLSLNNQL